MYEKEKIIADVDLLALASSLGIPVKKVGQRLSALCPFHSDKHYGSAYLIDKIINGRVLKGLYCYSCSKYWSLIDLVRELAGISIYSDILKYLISFCPKCENEYFGSRSGRYVDDKTNYAEAYFDSKKKAAYELQQKILQEQEKKRAYILKTSELELLGLYSCHIPEFSAVFLPVGGVPNTSKNAIKHYYYGNAGINMEELNCKYEKSNTYQNLLTQLCYEDFGSYINLIIEKAFEKKQSVLKIINQYVESDSRNILEAKMLSEAICKLEKIEDLICKFSKAMQKIA